MENFKTTELTTLAPLSKFDKVRIELVKGGLSGLPSLMSWAKNVVADAISAADDPDRVAYDLSIYMNDIEKEMSSYFKAMSHFKTDDIIDADTIEIMEFISEKE